MWRRRWVGLARWGGAVRCGAMGGAVGDEGGEFFSLEKPAAPVFCGKLSGHVLTLYENRRSTSWNLDDVSLSVSSSALNPA